MFKDMISTFEFSKNVVGIMIDSNVDKELLKEVHEFIESKFVEDDTINLLVEIKPGVEIPVFIMFQDLLFKLSHNRCFRKIAVISEEGFFKKVMKFKDILMDAEVKTYNIEDRIAAMNWIAE